MFTESEIASIIVFRENGMSLDQVARLYLTDRITIRKTESNYYRKANNG